MRAAMKSLNNPLLKAIFVIAFGFLIFTVCNVSTAKLSDVSVCSSVGSDGLCDGSKSTFSQDAGQIFCTANLKNAPSDTKVTFTWKKDGEQVATADVSTSSGTVKGTLTSGGSFAPGSYSVTVKINTDNSEPVTKEFKVE